MKPIFTIHGGEYLFANEFETRFPEHRLWLPVKDEGIDFLITDSMNIKTLGIQVKYSRDYNLLQKDNNIRENLKSLGWFHLNSKKIENSKADYWVLINYEGFSKTTDFFFIKPKVLLDMYRNLGRNGSIIDSYLWVMQKEDKAFETRDLGVTKRKLILSGSYHDKGRDFSKYLNKWDIITNYFK